jgi:hypothetical protein
MSEKGGDLRAGGKVARVKRGLTGLTPFFLLLSCDRAGLAPFSTLSCLRNKYRAYGFSVRPPTCKYFAVNALTFTFDLVA